MSDKESLTTQVRLETLSQLYVQRDELDLLGYYAFDQNGFVREVNEIK